MINGVYAKDGETVEFVGNGMEEITPEERIIHAFPMVARKRQPRRRVDSFTVPNAIMMGVSIGMPLGLLVCYAIMDGDKVMQILTVVSIGVAAVWLHQNFWRKK